MHFWLLSNLSGHLFVLQSICLGCNLPDNTSGSASGDLRICLHVCSIGCISACLNAYLPLSECLHCYSTIWLSFRLSAYLPLSDCSSAHLAASGSGSGRISVWSTICLLFCLFCRLLILLLILSIFSSAGLFCCLRAAISSICLFHRPGANPSLHLPIWQSRFHAFA